MIWNQLASKYDRLWVQKYSLTPTREKVLDHLANLKQDDAKLLDLGCGTGQLLEAIGLNHPDFNLYGLDKSKAMLQVAKKKHIPAVLVHKDLDEDQGAIADKNLTIGTFDRVICSHSFPYYKNKQAVLAWVASLLKEEGVAIFTQASINSAYDRFVMKLIEKTAEPADYLSVHDFKEIIEPWFHVTQIYLIRKRRYMPSIYGFVLRKQS